MPRGDIFHATEHLLPPMRTQKSVFTIHDLIFRFFPEYHLPLNRWYLSLMLPRFMRRADAIIAVSENTRRDVSRLMGIPSEKIQVIYEGVHPCFHPIRDADEIARVCEKYRVPEKFILYLSTIEPRKNVVGLVQAFHALLAQDATTPDLVIAGRKGWLYQPVFQHVHDLGLESRVHFTDWIEEVDAPTLISAAEMFVYPSLYEGFGLPPLEAMACGTPLICSNAASLPEVVGDAALLVNPKSVNEISAAMSRVLSDAALRDEMRAKGIARAAQFTWERAARETLAVYHQVTDSK
jgi:glycosyltransferase involved in cell wall biosynthesis